MEQRAEPSGVDWELAAYHEAGHAVVATVLGFKADVVRLQDPAVPSGKLATKTEFGGVEPTTLESKIQTIWNRATYLVCGRLCEFKGTARCFEPGWIADDLQIDWWYEILQAASPSTCPNKQDFLRDVQERAEALAAENWSAVEAVAAELLTSRQIEGSRLREIIASCVRRHRADANGEGYERQPRS